MPRHHLFAIPLLLLALASAASATTYVPVADRDLAAQAGAIARVRVLGEQPGPADQPPATDYLVAVDRLVQGHLPGGTVVVRVPGGERADGLVQHIAGAPRLREGEEALLFLRPAADGTFGLLHLALGAFHARRAGAALVAEPDLGGMERLGPAAAPADDGRVRDLERFTNWLEDRAAGIEREADYWVRRPAGPQANLEKAYAPLPTPDGIAPRWFDFDGGWSVGWAAHQAGQAGMGPARTAAAVEAALAAWTVDPTSDIRLHYEGTTSAATGHGATDRVNAFLFGDPNEQVPGTFDCTKGGVLAMGGPYFWSQTKAYRGGVYHEIAEADVVTNDGAECYLAKDDRRAAEVFAHEIGHTLGFGHASDAEALMWASAHGDGRGARLGEDDRVAASQFYGDGSYRPAPAPPPTPEPAGKPVSFAVVASAARTEIRLDWTAEIAGATSFQIESQVKKGFRAVATVPGTAHGAMLTSLAPNRLFKLRVTARGADGAMLGTSQVVRVRTKK